MTRHAGGPARRGQGGAPRPAPRCSPAHGTPRRRWTSATRARPATGSRPSTWPPRTPCAKSSPAARPQDTITGEEHGTTRPGQPQRLPLVHRPAGRHHQLHPEHRLLRHLCGSGGFRRRLAGRRRQRPRPGPRLLRRPAGRAPGWRRADRRTQLDRSRPGPHRARSWPRASATTPRVRAEQAGRSAAAGRLRRRPPARVRRPGPVPGGRRNP